MSLDRQHWNGSGYIHEYQTHYYGWFGTEDRVHMTVQAYEHNWVGMGFDGGISVEFVSDSDTSYSLEWDDFSSTEEDEENGDSSATVTLSFSVSGGM